MAFLLHLHPKAVPEESLRLSRTFGLGGMALVLMGVLVVTGALLVLVYDPSTEGAWTSVARIQDQLPNGGFLRAIHHHAGNGLLLVCFLHMLRVFYTGGMLPPRRTNWLVGLALLAVVAAGNFTGYLLPWDQLSYWAVAIGTGMLQYLPLLGEPLLHLARGGQEVGPRTLSLFYSLHVAGVPLALLALSAFHVWQVRKAGGVRLVDPPDRRPVLVPTDPNLVLREVVAALVLLALLCTLAAVIPAPLQEAANPGMSPNPAKAPWYFMGIQELLIHLPPAVTVLLVPAVGLAFLAGLTFLRYDPPPSGLWFHSPGGRRAVVLSALLAVAVTLTAVFLDERDSRWSSLSTGIWVGGLGAVALALRRTPRIELVQGLFTFVTATFLVLTAVGIFFRGPQMRLGWPW